MNEAVQGYDALIQFFNAIYFWLDFPLIVGIGLWLYFFGRRHHYTVARDALLASGAIALVCYHLFPVAPPRLLPPEYAGDFVDTVNEYSNFSYQAQSMQPFVNPYAAVPSLHYGWAVLVGASSSGRRRTSGCGRSPSDAGRAVHRDPVHGEPLHRRCDGAVW